MDSTINSSRVQVQMGIFPTELGRAPNIIDLDSEIVSPETYDEVALNLSGRATSDPDDDRSQNPTSNNTLRCKNKHVFSTFNARTLAPVGRIEELMHCCQQYSTEILAIQEHRFYHPDDPYQSTMIGNYILITSSCWKNSINASVGGIGFLLSSKVKENLVKTEPITPRIFLLEFSGNPKLTVLCVYSPHNESPEHEVDQFYSDLRSVLENVPPHNFLSIMGDFNARLGPDLVNFTFNNETNRNGEKLFDLMEEYNLFSANNSFMKSKNQLWTYESPSGLRSQLDYMLFRKKWKNSIHNSRSFSSFTVSSDHRVVSSSVQLSLRSSKKAKPHPMKCFDWKEVARNNVLSKQFSLEVYNRFQSLCDVSDLENSLEDTYDSLIACTESVAKEMLPRKKKAVRNETEKSTQCSKC